MFTTISGHDDWFKVDVLDVYEKKVGFRALARVLVIGGFIAIFSPV